MAETNLRSYTSEERLNKMDVDVIDITITPDTSAYAVGDLMWTQVEIPNAVSVSGGSCIIQSVACIGTSTDGNETGNFDIIVASNNFGHSKAGPATMSVNDAMSACISPIANIDGTLGIISITNMTDIGTLCMIGGKGNLGIVGKSESDSTSLYCWGISQGTDTWASPSLVLRFGIVKD